MLRLEGLIELLDQVRSEDSSRVERVLDQIRTYQNAPEFGDDFSMLEIDFGA